MRDDIAAVIPAYQCESTIAAVVTGARSHVGRAIAVDDGSTDATAEAAREAGGDVLSLPGNRGKGFALRHGIAAALAGGAEAVVLLDGDGQHDPADIPRLVAAWDRGAGNLVIGSRMGSPETMPGERYWTNYIGSRVLSWMTGHRLEDSQSGFRLLSAPLLAGLGLESDGYAVESEMLIKAAHRGARIAHVPVRTIYEADGGSHFRPLRDTLRISWWAVVFKARDVV
jgi:glycosyltransferase involved in cell wall biosynthesis